MHYLKTISTLLFLSFFILSCEENIDTETPEIDLSLQDAFPTNCDTLYFGEPFQLKLLLTDNQELGSLSIDIHNNFDHHSHTTEINTCTMESEKSPVNPYVTIQDFEIPSGLQQYETNITINIPSGNESSVYDDGDYHFYISLTDKEGWSAQKGLSIKLFHR